MPSSKMNENDSSGFGGLNKELVKDLWLPTTHQRPEDVENSNEHGILEPQHDPDPSRGLVEGARG